MRLRTDCSSNELDAGRDVPPLVAAPNLQQHTVPSMQLQEVVSLEKHVAELSE